MARKSDIRLRRSNVANAVPGGADLNEGELAINTADGALYFKKSDGTIITGHDNTIMHIDSTNSRVGIGTSTPGTKLSVSGGIIRVQNGSNVSYYEEDKIHSYASSGFTIDGREGLTLETSTADTDIILNPTGYVGIGTASPSSLLNIKGDDANLIIQDTSSGYATQTASLTLTGSTGSGSARTDVQHKVKLNADNLTFTNGTNDDERMRIQKNGNVGIGTSSPSEKLTVDGDGAFKNTTDATGATLKVADSSNRAITITSPIAASAAAGRVAVTGTSNSLEIGVRDYPTALKIEGSSGNALFSSSVTVSKTSSGNILQVASLVNPVGASNTGVRLWMSGTNTTDRGTFIDAVAESTSNNHTLRFGTSASASAPVEAMRIDSSGNLLVNQTATSDYTNTAGSSFRATGFSTHTRDGGDVLLLNRLTSDGNILLFRKDNTTVGSIGVSSSDELFLGGTADTDAFIRMGYSTIAPATSTGTNRDDSISFGASNNRFKDLHLSGNAYIGSSAYAQYFGNASDTNTLIQFAGSDDIRFRVGGTETVRINTNGVGIGTSSPQANMALDVRSDASTAGSTGIASYGYNATGRAILGNGYATSGTGTNKGIEGISTGPRSSVSGSVNVGGHFYATGAETNYALTTGAGNVGINTSSPAKQLHIHQPSGETGFLLSRNNGLTSTNIQLSVDSTKTRFISYGDLTFMTATTGSGTNASERMRISTDGKVGIGTNSPGHKLHVVGANNTTPFSIDIGAAASYNFKANSNSTYSTTFNMDADGLTIGHDSAYREVALQTAGTNRLVIAPAGAITFNNAFTFPTSIGSAGQVLKVPNSGSVLVWSDQTGGGGSTDSISDSDGDTKIQVEESADEDIIRFDIAGTQKMFLSSAQLGITGNLLVSGNLTVNGTQTILNTATLSVDDLNITVADGAADAAAANGAGLTVAGANATLLYASSGDKFVFNKSLDVTGTTKLGTSSYSAGIDTITDGSLVVPQGSRIVTQDAAGNNYLRTIFAHDAANNNYIFGQQGTSLIGDMVFFPGSSGNFRVFASGSEDFRVASTGRVGIGTTSPTNKLTVSQSADANGIRINGYDDRSDCFAEMHISPTGNTVIRQVNADSTGYLQIQAQNYLELSGPSLVYTGSNFRIYDSGSLQIGTHNDLELSHDGTNNLIKNINGNLYIRNDADDGDIVLQSDDGSGGVTEYLKLEGSTGSTILKSYGAEKAKTQSWGLLVTGTLNADSLHIGSGVSDLISVHNDSTSNQIATYRNNQGGFIHRTYGDHGNDGTIVEVQTKVGADGNFSSTGNFSAHDFRLRTNNLDRMTVDGGGNIGIGITNPSNLLHIHATGNGSSALIIEDDARRLEMGRDMIQAKSSNGSTVQNLYIQPAGVTSFASNSGSVAIGNTSTLNGAKLYVKNGTSGQTYSNTSGILIDVNGNSNSYYGLRVGSSSGNNHLAVTNAGNVGIGTSSPTSKVHISGTSDGSGSGADAMLHVKQNGSWNGNEPWALYVEGYSYLNGFRINSEDGIRGLYKTTSGGSLGFATSDTAPITFTQSDSAEKMRIHSNGFVGIGNTNPKAKLQVEEYGIDTTTSSTTAVTQVAIHTFPIADFRSARFTIQITNTTDSTYHSTEILAIHDGTTANITEFGEVHTGSSVEATFDADVSSSNFRLLATPASTNSMTFKVVCHSLTV